MKTNYTNSKKGSVLVLAMLTITILTLICATSLYIVSQDSNGAMQTAAWQESLTAAESGIDAGIRALNTGTWTNWVSVGSASLPTAEPSPSPVEAAISVPDTFHYNYLPSSALTLPLQGEGASSISTWVTIDTAGMSTSDDTNGQQWYRIRSTGRAALAGSARVSGNRLDNILRNSIALHFNRNGDRQLGPWRRIEVIVQPVSTSSGTRGILSRKTFYMSGNGYIDSFDSSNPFKSTNHLYDINKRQSHGDVGILDSTGSDLANGTYLYGNLTYSGPAVQHTQHVQGTISTPFNATVPQVYAPSWGAGTYSTSLPPSAGNTTTLVGGTSTGTVRYKLSSLSLAGQQTLSIQSPTVNGVKVPGYVEIWITGDLATSGQAGIVQDSQVQVKYYVEGNINLAGNSITNLSGYAAYLQLYGVTPLDGSTRTAYIAGNGGFIGLVDAPAYDTVYAGNGDFSGALIALTLTVQGNGNIHYDEALRSLISTITPPTYSFASWMENDSDKARGILY
jgi:hypothetical protein